MSNGLVPVEKSKHRTFSVSLSDYSIAEEFFAWVEREGDKKNAITAAALRIVMAAPLDLLVIAKRGSQEAVEAWFRNRQPSTEDDGTQLAGIVDRVQPVVRQRTAQEKPSRRKAGQR